MSVAPQCLAVQTLDTASSSRRVQHSLTTRHIGVRETSSAAEGLWCLAFPHTNAGTVNALGLLSVQNVWFELCKVPMNVPPI